MSSDPVLHTTAEALAAVRDEVLIDEDHWTQGHYAVDEHGFDTDPNDDQACAFCLHGAMLRVIADHEFDDAYYGRMVTELEVALDHQFGSHGTLIVDFNDDSDTTFDDVVTVVRLAADNAAKKAGIA